MMQTLEKRPSARLEPSEVRPILMAALVGPCCRSAHGHLPDTPLTEEEAAALANAVIAALTRVGLLEPEEVEATAL